MFITEYFITDLDILFCRDGRYPNNDIYIATLNALVNAPVASPRGGASERARSCGGGGAGSTGENGGDGGGSGNPVGGEASCGGGGAGSAGVRGGGEAATSAVHGTGVKKRVLSIGSGVGGPAENSVNTGEYNYSTPPNTMYRKGVEQRGRA